MSCPECGKPVRVAPRWHEWACSDPDCVKAHGPGPGGGHALFAGIEIITDADLPLGVAELRDQDGNVVQRITGTG
ncbi:hypothetical protein [Nocardioides taihuensis]|uniref:Uncharacterized protein n=1 Tax=Nocardioides taihuensis TaxID=1835606 RepID=A0ABW0BMB6_9ACTN